MPKISAATVAEHRARQREGLVAAATEILVERGVSAVTPAAVGARAGLARSSVYQYFSSTHDLIASIVEDSFPRNNQRIQGAVARATTPLGKVDAYVEQVLGLAAEGVHRAASALIVADLPQQCRARLAELHAEQAAPLVLALRDLGVPDPDLTAALVGGLLHSAMSAIERGISPKAVTARTLELIHHGL